MAPGDTPSLSAGELLDAWELASSSPGWVRPVALLAAGQLAGGDALLEALPVGERDQRLAALRRSVFGPAVQATTTCPACAEPAELSFTLDDVLPRATSPAGEGAGSEPAGTVRIAGYHVHFRLPTTADLASVATDDPGDVGAAVTALLARCVVSASGPSGSRVAAAELPDPVAQAVSAAMARADPAADVVLELSCPACGHTWAAPFDIAAFVWQEVDAWAERTLLEVDTLARAYGWNEPAVLALSPWRRRRYMELVSG